LTLGAGSAEHLGDLGVSWEVSFWVHVVDVGGCFFCFVLADEGDAVLIPAPYYARFESDMRVVAGCVPIPVYCKDPVVGPSPNELENATRKAEIRGHKVKILLLNNPNNPLGIIYPPHVMSNAIQWAQNRSIHTIANEIYALSTHQKEGHSFQSVIKILDNKLGNYVHFLWSVSPVHFFFTYFLYLFDLLRVTL